MTRVIVPHWIVIRIPGHNWTLNHDVGSQVNVELRPGVIIQRGIKTRGHHSRGSKFYPSEGSKYNDPLSREVAIQHEKSVESWSQPVELRPNGSKFNGVKIQSYTGSSHYDKCACEVWKWLGKNCSRYRVHKVKRDGTTHPRTHPPTHEPTHSLTQSPTNGRVTISPPTLLRGDNYQSRWKILPLLFHWRDILLVF